MIRSRYHHPTRPDDVNRRPGRPDSVDDATADVRLGASPRAAQAMLAAAKVLALARGRQHVTRQDVSDVAPPTAEELRVLRDEVDPARVYLKVGGRGVGAAGSSTLLAW